MYTRMCMCVCVCVYVCGTSSCTLTAEQTLTVLDKTAKIWTGPFTHKCLAQYQVTTVTTCLLSQTLLWKWLQCRFRNSVPYGCNCL